MKPPIILDNRGDLRFFRAAHDAEAYAEPIDVRNGEYVGYDSQGRILSLTVVSEQVPGLLGRFGGHSERVVIGSEEATPQHAEELSGALRGFLRRAGVNREWLNSASLDELVQKGLDLQGG
jgi:hypothetical protein